MTDRLAKAGPEDRGILSIAAAAAVRAIDAFIDFIALERALILRNVRIAASGNISRAFVVTIRMFVVIDAHVYLYWVVQRPMPGTISFLDFNSAAFALWAMFSFMTHRVVSPALGAQFNVAANVRWINLLIADFVWELTRILLAAVLVYTQFLVFPQRSVSAVTHLPNMPLLIGMFLLMGALGGGFGLVLHSAAKRWPIVDASMEAMMWFLFVTSGIYEAYMQLPPAIGDYFRLNPVMVVIEYARVALDPGYPVGDLDLLYPAAVALALVTVGLLLRRSGPRTTSS